jgi:hypothetical protein
MYFASNLRATQWVACASGMGSPTDTEGEPDHRTEWREARARGELAGLTPKKRGPAKREIDERDRRIAELFSPQSARNPVGISDAIGR